MTKRKQGLPTSTRLNRFEEGIEVKLRSEVNPADKARAAIWYGLTELEQFISMAASHQAPQEIRVLSDLMNDAWLIWDRDWTGTKSNPLLIVSYLERIGGKLKSAAAVAHVAKVRGLVEDFVHLETSAPLNVNTGSLRITRAK